MLNVTIEDQKLVQQLTDMPARLRSMLYKTVFTLALKLQKHIVVDKLQGQVLGHRSGNLQRSIQNDVTQNGPGVYGRVFSSGDVKYAAIHEFGGRIPAHIIEPKNGEALRFIMNGKEVFARRVNHPGSNRPERSFMRSSLRDMRAEIISSIEKTVQEATAV